MTEDQGEPKTALSDPENVHLRAINETGDAFQDPAWRAAVGLPPLDEHRPGVDGPA